jgi:threonine aldolase
VSRLAIDHENAGTLARGLAQIEALAVDPAKVQTNMVFFTMESSRFKALQAYLKERGILISGREKVRLVTHLDVSAEDIGVVVGAFRDFFQR